LKKVGPYEGGEKEPVGMPPMGKGEARQYKYACYHSDPSFYAHPFPPETGM
jgi:hypothetical protein